MRRFCNLLVVVLFLFAVAPVNTRAQNTQGTISAAGSTFVATASTPGESSPTTQNIVSSLSTLPEVDALVYVNPQRILNEVLPKFLPAKDVEGMRRSFEDVKKNAGIDPTKVDYIVIATRFKKPTADLNFQAPEFMMMASGDFSAESLIVLARMASQGRLREEKYGTKTLGLMTIDPLVKEAQKNPFLNAFTEVAIVTLNANTIAAGTPAFLRAAIDAGDGKERIRTETLNSLVRDPNALISFAGTPWQSFAKSFGMMGTDANPRAARCESKMGDIYAALTMDATNFMLRGVMNADNPDTAKIISKLYSGFLGYAANSIPDASAQSLLKGFAITSEGDEVLVRADFPQQMVIDLIKEKMKPKQVDAGAPPPPANPAVKRRRIRRRA
ncbi:MAG: hypothetical protein ABR501_10880 [Pyrinomonadaceae bacterium]